MNHESKEWEKYMNDNYPSGLIGKASSYSGPGVAMTAERNPDALSSRIDQANNNLGSIEARLRDLLISVRGQVPSQSVNSVAAQTENILTIRTGELLSAIERVSDMLNELRSLL